MRKVLQEILSLLRLNTGRTNLKVVILCVVAATLFWFFNSLNKDYTANVRYPVSFLYDTDNYQAIDDLPEEVLLNMTGVGWNLLRKSLGIQTEPLMIRLESPDNTRSIPGSSLPSAVTDQVTDLQLNYVLTDTLYINIDRKISKTLVLALDRSSLGFDPRFVMGRDMILQPDSVILTGPESLVQSLGDTIFIRVGETSLDEVFEDELEIEIPNNNLITRNPPTVNVTIPVEQLVPLNLEIPITFRRFPPNTSVSDSVVRVRTWVRQSRQNEVDTSEISIIADFRKQNAADSTLIPVLEAIPDYLERIELDTVRLKLDIR